MIRLMRKTRWPKKAALCLFLLSATVARGEWTHRYPKLAGFPHQIYVEGYELPVLNAGPADPVASPDGQSLAVAMRGSLWRVELSTGMTRRLTQGGGLDSRPAFSPDGKLLAAVRDTGTDTRLILVDLAKKSVRTLVDSPGIELDPCFTTDGRAVLYSSSEAGDLDLWKVELATGARTRLTKDQPTLELRPLAHPNGREVVYLTKTRSGADTLSLLDLQTGDHRVLRHEAMVTQLRPALSRDGSSLVLNLPDAGSLDDAYKLWLLDLSGDNGAGKTGERALQPFVLDAPPHALGPAFSANGQSVYFSAPDAQHRFHLYQVPVVGGAPKEVPLRIVDEPAGGWLVVKTMLAGSAQPVAARLHIADKDGQPLFPEQGMVRFDGQNGLTFVYSPGELKLPVPAGPVRVLASHGFSSATERAELNVAAGETREITLGFRPLVSLRQAGWYSGDHHLHLNYGGSYQLDADELALVARAEDLDVATPLVANLNERPMDLQKWRRFGVGPHAGPDQGLPILAFGHEVRSHLLGHLGLIGIAEPFFPWYWGPGLPGYHQLDLPNAEPLASTRRQGGISSYVHPVRSRDPLTTAQGQADVPLELVADAVLGEVDTLEIACLWSDELGTSALWYQLLNLGVPLSPSAGTDVMMNLYRNMAIGTTRVYVKVEPPMSFDRYLAALRAGKSFVTTGPLLEFSVADKEPGSAVPAGPQTVPWKLRVTSGVPFEQLEVLVNGKVVWSGRGLDAPGQTSREGTLTLPPGGWIAARAHGGTTQWPAMDSYPFAHSAPIWIGKVGSREPVASQQSAQVLLKLIASSESRLAQAFPIKMPRISQQLARARKKLEGLAAAR